MILRYYMGQDRCRFCPNDAIKTLKYRINAVREKNQKRFILVLALLLVLMVACQNDEQTVPTLVPTADLPVVDGTDMLDTVEK